MLKEHKNTFEILFRVFDILILISSLFIAYYLRFGKIEFDVFYVPYQYLLFSFTFLLAWFYLSYRFRLYTSKRLTNFISESLSVSQCIGICFIIAVIPPFFIREYPLSRVFLVYFLTIHAGSLILFRFIVRHFLKHIRLRGYNFRNILIVGRNQRAEKLVKKIKETPEYGIRILGYIDCGNNGNHFNCDIDCIGKIEDLERILRDDVVDEVFVSLPIKSFYTEIDQIISICEQVGVEVKIPTDLFSLKLAKSTVSKYHDIHVIDFFTSPKMTWQLMVKRLIDIFFSLFLLIIFAPLLLVVSTIIKMTSTGPVLFVQQRIGYNGRLFNLFKFRTMVEDAEVMKEELSEINEMRGPVFKIKDDPRITKVGRFLRKTSIDEMPQLVNVLIGEMSLVGPRPPVPNEVSQYNMLDRRRLSMKPGITCIWQVNGRNLLNFNKWMELDRMYIDNWSLWLDIKIIAKTVTTVLKGDGAY